MGASESIGHTPCSHQSLAFESFAALSLGMVDATVYTSADATPELAVRQIFAKTRIKTQMRVLLADKGLLDVDAWAATGESLEHFRTNITRLMTNGRLGVDDEEREGALICLAACWRKCRALADVRNTRRARMEEDPLRIPEMSVQEYGQKRIQFTDSHKDFIMTDFNTPHKRFLERFDRDFTIHEIVLRYELGEVRLKSEHIAQKGGLTQTSEQLIKKAVEDIPATVLSEDDALNRITAFYVACEFQGHVRCGRFEGDPAKGDASGGPSHS